VPLPRLPYVVVDMNQTRDLAVITPLLEEYKATGQRVWMPWRQLYELSKSSNALSTFKQSVALFQSDPGILAVARPSFWAVRKERDIAGFKTNASTLLDEVNTKHIQRMLAELRNNTPGVEQAITASLQRVLARRLREGATPRGRSRCPPVADAVPR
jgi:hypothetical protein